jgi:hypothetical protein
MYRTSRFSSRPSRWLAAALGLAGVLCGAAPGLAQDELTAPPRIPAATQPTPAAPPTNTDPTALEEIVVISDQNPWRLPDLGSEWRARQVEEPDTGRIAADFLPLWDPETEELPTRNPFAVTDSIRRVGFIEVFRIRFGGR